MNEGQTSLAPRIADFDTPGSKTVCLALFNSLTAHCIPENYARNSF